MSTIPQQSSLRFQDLSVSYVQTTCDLAEPIAIADLSPAAYSMSKRAMDIIGSAVGLLLLSPVMVLVALMVRLDSRGPILFRQARMGHGGRTFRFLKFRTMALDAESRLAELEGLNESAGGILFKMRNDPRITRVGRFLRRTSLDELPQLFNILVGHMSLKVGPRPLQMKRGLPPPRIVRCRGLCPCRAVRASGLDRGLAGRRPQRRGLHQHAQAGPGLR